ncbi:hypothetical protein [Frigoriflavimonas asaccharolytica]|uniref:Uncharacterized protein n=1 Tax=Frigoriflavimonas asaccharolytica TaxID=2735899 RepID=A0A8J8K8H1_9FLAO|nr:hypothetical protein [Frigoriflavimonas asaccharolytica]NRS92973.1 hypothetical protein [Frigoriflavimonas asaccharolytica]
MKYFQIIILLFSAIAINCQSLDKITNLSAKIENQRELRIYKDRGITNSGMVFRIYEENKNWKAELIQWFLPKQISEDDFEMVAPIITKLRSDKKLEEIFMNIEARNIKYLPQEENFTYKKSKNKVVFDDEEKDLVIISAKSTIIDGNSYLVDYKSHNQINKFNYSNPESYLEIYPEIDELNYFVDILNYIRKEFNIKF